MRIILAAIVGGIIMFAWGAVAHMFTPLGEMGLKEMPNDTVVMPVLAQNITEPGLYGFPAAAMGKDAKMDLPAGPMGLLIYKPNGKWEMTNEHLIKEFVTNFLAALLGAIIAASLTGSMLKRAILLTLIGVIGWLSISASYHIWFNFPEDFTHAEGIMQLVGWLATGLAIATIVKPAMPRAA